ncbi:hypothetical protein ACU686_43965 [Yinghuangia aomiensis]
MADFEVLSQILGPPSAHGRWEAAWPGLERELGLTFPEDFKAITNAYAPGLFADWLEILPPSARRSGLAAQIQAGIRELNEFPERIGRVAGTGVGQVLPVGYSVNSDMVGFLVNSLDPRTWTIGVRRTDIMEDPSWFEYAMGYGELAHGDGRRRGGHAVPRP